MSENLIHLLVTLETKVNNLEKAITGQNKINASEAILYAKQGEINRDIYKSLNDIKATISTKQTI